MMTFEEAIKRIDEPRLDELYVNVPFPGTNFAAREVMLWFPDAVVVMGDYNDLPGRRVSPLDLEGNCLLRIPSNEVLRVMTLEEVMEFEKHDGYPVGVRH